MHRPNAGSHRLTTLAGLLLVAALPAAAQNLPAGTHSANEPPTQSTQSAEQTTNTELRSAESALERGDYTAAIAALKPLAAAQPKNAHVLYDLGFAEEHSSDDTAAAAAYAEAIAADPTVPEPQIALGLLDARNGRTEAAHRELQTASQLSTAGPALRARALRSLAILDENTDPDAARDELLAALKLSPETPADILLTARLAEHASAFPEAEAAYRHLLTLTPGDPTATAGLAHALEAQDKPAEAETLLTTALKTHPGDPRLLSQLAALYGSEGNAAQAIPLLENLQAQLRAANPGEAPDPAITHLLAHLYVLNGDFAKAEPLYRDLAAKDPTNPMRLDDLASTLVEEQKFTEAEALLKKSVAMRSNFPSDSDWAEAAGALAFAASRNHDPQITLQALAARATVLPNSPASLFLEATAHDSLHQFKDAERDYRAFLAIAGGKYPDQEFQARHRLIALEHER
ncbi:MAG TPA: tetratricopeptide repeat protein [Acidobacteriaceae bacterium]|jgi:Flp pilus assembly protein TadD|nr:tetratricopeptide repeat protein [Acidobacteriaceae bacterium]